MLNIPNGILFIDNVNEVAAMLDRLLHHAHVVSLKADSYRMKDRLRVGSANPGGYSFEQITGAGKIKPTKTGKLKPTLTLRPKGPSNI